MLADLARAVAARAGAPAISLAVVCRDGPRMAQLSRALSFFGPDILTMEFPAWDCLPYDRVSPNAGVVAQRMTALSRLTRVKGRDRPSVLLTTVNAALQRVPARDFVGTHALSVAPGNVTGMASIVEWLELNGFIRASTVREPGEYAVRGGILDLFPPGMDMPVRLDFFGDALETIRSFDAQTQRSEESLRGLDLVPVSEFQLVTETIRRFRTGYVAQFGACGPDDLLYEAVSEGRRYPGMEHWLPLFHGKLETLFDYLPGTALALEHLADDAAHERLAQVADYYEARQQALKDGVTPPYKPLPPERLYLAKTEWRERLDTSALARLSPFAVPEAANVIDTGARAGRNFAAERAEPNANVFEAVTRHVQALQGAGKRVAVALWSEGARERMSHVLADHKLHNLSPVASWPQALALPKASVALAVLGIESGFETDDAAIVSEQDILGDRLVRPRRASAPRGELHRRSDQPRARRSGGACRSRHRPLCRPAADRSGRRAARLPGNPLRRRLQAVPAGGERRPVVALRLGRKPRRPRPAGRRRLAGAQGAHEEPHPRDRRRVDQDRGRAAIARGAAADRRARRL